MTHKCLVQISGREALPFTEVCRIWHLGYIQGGKSGAHIPVYCCFTMTPWGTMVGAMIGAISKLACGSQEGHLQLLCQPPALSGPPSFPHSPLWPWLMHEHPGVITAHLGTGAPSQQSCDSATAPPCSGACSKMGQSGKKKSSSLPFAASYIYF